MRLWRVLSTSHLFLEFTKRKLIVLRDCNGLSRSRVWVNVLYLRETDSEAGRKSIDIVRWWLMMTHSTHTWYIIVRAPTWEGVITRVCLHVLCDVLKSSHHRILHKPHQHLAHSRNYRPKDVYFNISKRAFELKYDVSAFPQKGFKKRKRD